MVDAEDLERIRENAITTVSVGVGPFSNYASFRNKEEKTVRLHRFVMNTPKGLVVDHLNFNGLDNRKNNLRNCTSKENNHPSRRRAIENPLYMLYRTERKEDTKERRKDNNKVKRRVSRKRMFSKYEQLTY